MRSWFSCICPNDDMIDGEKQTRKSVPLSRFKAVRIPAHASAKGEGDGRRFVALETTGDHLQNPDTDYQRDVLNFMAMGWSWNTPRQPTLPRLNLSA